MNAKLDASAIARAFDPKGRFGKAVGVALDTPLGPSPVIEDALDRLRKAETHGSGPKL